MASVPSFTHDLAAHIHNNQIYIYIYNISKYLYIYNDFSDFNISIIYIRISKSSSCNSFSFWCISGTEKLARATLVSPLQTRETSKKRLKAKRFLRAILQHQHASVNLTAKREQDEMKC